MARPAAPESEGGMRITVREGVVQVDWNDRGDPGDPPQICVGSLIYTITSENDLRDLHACLDFLYARPK